MHEPVQATRTHAVGFAQPRTAVASRECASGTPPLRRARIQCMSAQQWSASTTALEECEQRELAAGCVWAGWGRACPKQRAWLQRRDQMLPRHAQLSACALMSIPQRQASDRYPHPQAPQLQHRRGPGLSFLGGESQLSRWRYPD